PRPPRRLPRGGPRGPAPLLAGRGPARRRRGGAAVAARGRRRPGRADPARPHPRDPAGRLPRPGHPGRVRDGAAEAVRALCPLPRRVPRGCALAAGAAPRGPARHRPVRLGARLPHLRRGRGRGDLLPPGHRPDPRRRRHRAGPPARDRGDLRGRGRVRARQHPFRPRHRARRPPPPSHDRTRLMTTLAPPAPVTAPEAAPTPRPARRRRDLAGRIGLPAASAVVAVVLLPAPAPDLLAPQAPLEISRPAGCAPPSAAPLFGTDQSGRDVFSRVIPGARQSLVIGIGATALGLLGALVLGLLGGLGGRLADGAVTRVIEVLYAFPGILLALILIAVYGNSALTQMVAVGLATMPGYARMVR